MPQGDAAYRAAIAASASRMRHKRIGEPHMKVLLAYRLKGLFFLNDHPCRLARESPQKNNKSNLHCFFFFARGYM